MAEHNDDEPMSTSDLPFVPWESLSPAEKITALEIALRQAQQQLAEHNDKAEPTTSHLLAYGQNRNQYTGSEPTTWQETHDCPCLHLDHACVGSDCDTCRGFNHANWPTTPKPQHVHERFKLIFSEDMREVVFRICEDCQYGDLEDYWRGWEARGLAKPVKDSH